MFENPGLPTPMPPTCPKNVRTASSPFPTYHTIVFEKVLCKKVRSPVFEVPSWPQTFGTGQPPPL